MQPTPPTPPARGVRIWAVPIVAVVDLAVAYVGGFVALALLVGTGSFGVGPWPVTVGGTVVVYACGIVLLRAGRRVWRGCGLCACVVALCVGVPMIGVTAATTAASLVCAVAAVAAAAGAVVVRRSAGTVGLAVACVCGALFVVAVTLSG